MTPGIKQYIVHAVVLFGIFLLEIVAATLISHLKGRYGVAAPA